MIDATPRPPARAGAPRARARRAVARWAGPALLCLASLQAAAGDPVVGRQLPLQAPDAVDAGTADRTRYTILVDTLNRRGMIVQYHLQGLYAGETTPFERTVLGDCARRLRGIVPPDAPPGSRIPLDHVAPRSREATELDAACALPEGPPARWFPALAVTADGVVLAPARRVRDCDELVALVGRERRRARPLGDASANAVAVLKVDGGRLSPVPLEAAAPAREHRPVTLIGVHGVVPKVRAASTRASDDPGADDEADPDDRRWPQLETLGSDALAEGAVWDASGAVVGLATGAHDAWGRRFLVRMMPAARLRARLAAAGVTALPSQELAEPAAGRARPAPGGDGMNAPAPPVPDPAAAMRRMVAATLPMTCERRHEAAPAARADAKTR